MNDNRIGDPPDPRTASTPVDLTERLEALRLWAGRPSLRRLRRLGGSRSAANGADEIDALPETTTSYVLRGDRPASAEFVRSFVAACMRARQRDGAEIASQVELWHDAWLAVSAGAEAAPIAAIADTPARRSVPRQLPADVSGFTGRADALAALDALLLTGAAADRPPVVISAIAGTAGVGKTALAVRWAHRVAHQFPDGQLYVNLRGYDPDQPIDALDALARFLAALGVASQDIPLEADDRAARYRTEIARRRMLILLDNASSVEQVRPLLPGTGSCVVVVTSRDSLAGLVAVQGAHRLDLDLLPRPDAISLLRQLIGPRGDTEADALTLLAELCARLPLALRVAAELAISRPTTSMADLVAELADQRRRLDLLNAGGDPRSAVTTVFSWSIRHLPAATARTFRLLGLHPGADIDPYCAAALTRTNLERARRDLDRLARAHLLFPAGGDRYGMHDLLRAFAMRLTTTHDPDKARRAASERLLDYYLATAAAAADLLHTVETQSRRQLAPLTTPMPELRDPAGALAWLDSQRPVLVAVAAHATAHGWHTHTIRLAGVLSRYLDGGHYADALSIHDNARGAAERIGDQPGQAWALLSLGLAHFRLSRFGQATEHYTHALTLFRQAGDQSGEARALNNLSGVEQRLGRHEEAAGNLRRALLLFRHAGNLIGEAQALNNLGGAEQLLGRHRDAAEHHRQALALYRKAGDRLGEASALSKYRARRTTAGPASASSRSLRTGAHPLPAGGRPDRRSHRAGQPRNGAHPPGPTGPGRQTPRRVIHDLPRDRRSRW